MSKIEMLESKIFKYEFDILIESSISNVWSLLVAGIDQWWMSDFRALGEDSVMTFDLSSGGTLLESGQNGAILEWYRVQSFTPEENVYLVGYMAPDWGGPTVSMLKLGLKDEGESCVLTVSDALLGNVSDNKAINAESGWKRLFGDGFKAFAEK